jgi:intracellular sulfur oxidation DsrE/DsrF family protein
MKIMGFIFGVVFSFQSMAGLESFTEGPLIQGYGKHAKVEQDMKIPENMRFKVTFDVSDSGGNEALNRKFDSLARFLNMHVADGIVADNIKLALVIHGKASADLLNEKAFQQKFESSNPNQALLQLLLKHKVQIFLCGQSAAFYDINNADLIGGVQMALSAMTAHAILQQQGYQLNPF